MLFVLNLFGEDRSVLFEIFDLLVDGKLHTDIDFGLLGLSGNWVTISFLRTEMLLAYYSRKDFSFFHKDSDNIFRNTINRTLNL